MSIRTLAMTPELSSYLERVSVTEPDVLRRLREETKNLRGAGMQIGADQGQLLRFLVETIGATKALEVGVYTGYSSISVALGLPPNGKLVCCDTSEEWTSVARRYWKEAGVESKIDLRLGPALETLDALIASGDVSSFDFCFVDADKEPLLDYYERCLRLVRPRGLIGFDNVLWSGRVIDESDQSPGTLAIRALNEKLGKDPRVAITMLPVGDGLTLARRIA